MSIARGAATAHPVTFSVTYEWYCPNCGKEDQTHETGPHVRYHTCPKLRYLSAPMLRKGKAGKIEVKEWDDYVGDERPTMDPERGRPISSIITTRDNGQDCIAFAALATANARAR
jgi:hypothetical protein